MCKMGIINGQGKIHVHSLIGEKWGRKKRKEREKWKCFTKIHIFCLLFCCLCFVGISFFRISRFPLLLLFIELTAFLFFLLNGSCFCFVLFFYLLGCYKWKHLPNEIFLYRFSFSFNFLFFFFFFLFVRFNWHTFIYASLAIYHLDGDIKAECARNKEENY